MNSCNGTRTEPRGYAPVNGLKMYYEIEGEGDPLVHIPAAFGHAGLKSFPALIESHSVITMDLQGHGRTADIPDRPIMIAVRYPELVGRVATYGATFGPPRVAHNPGMTRYEVPPTAHSSAFEFQRESYRKVAPDPDYWPRIWEKIATLLWGGFSNEELASIKAPLLIALGDRDFVRLEHAVETLPLIPNAELAV